MLDLKKIPTNPGCYLFKDSKARIIYVGKAKNLKKRINSYFQKKNLDLKTQSMISHIKNFDFIVTDNEVEALVLENTLIKKYQPKYNVRLKDAKSHSYIRITNEEFPRALIARRKIGKGKFFGPFTSAQERDYTLQYVKKTFMLRSCKKLPKKECLRFHINLCQGPCIGNVSKSEYENKIKKVKQVLSGHSDKVIKALKKEMKEYSEKQDFEKALILRNQINALDHLQERQNMRRQKQFNEDIINYEIKDSNVYLMLFNIYKGVLHNKNEFIFDYNDDFLEQFIVQYYSENPIPKELILPVNISNSINIFLEEKKGTAVRIVKPQKGEKKQLLDLVCKNIQITYFSNINKVEILKTKLKLQENPSIIECFDISHLSGTSTVGSMVQFRNGKADKSNYRRFKIRSIQGIDDTAAIAEVVRRRYIRLKKENSELPDLIIIDGGRGQLNFAIQELNKLNLKIPIISIAKQFEEIFIPGRSSPLRLNKKDKALQFLQEIRDEAHRFAIKYNRLLRKKELIK
jgi:excinuclease ABC subunit C